MTIDDKVYDRFLNMVRDGEADVGTIDIRVDGRWQPIPFRPALARLVAERDDAIAQMNDADFATDNATQIAERVVRELRQEYGAVIEAGAKREAALRKTIEGIARTLAATANGWPYEHEPVLHVSQAVKLAVDTIDDLRAEVAALRRADAEDGEALAKRIDDLNFRLLKETKRADDAVAENERLRRVAETLVAGARDPATYDGIARAIVEARKVLEKTPDASTPKYSVSLPFFPFRRREETCAKCGRVVSPSFSLYIDGVKAAWCPECEKPQGVDVDALVEENAALRAENERLREALADIREWAKRDDFIRFDDGDIPLADYCAQALHGGK